ncbi:MAG: hypothetical protein LBV71_12155 [Prevotella sp.]|jgi:hypothetical protein|nr:hypothetical protein [Prevotella sp.]
MEKGRTLIYLLIAICFANSCFEDDYIKGYVQTNDIDINFVTDNAALCSGVVTVDFAGIDAMYTIIQMGIVFSKDSIYIRDISSNQIFSKDSTCISSQVNEGVFNCWLENLQPNTNYYIRAYAIFNCDYSNDSGISYRLYGDIQTFATKAYSNNFPAPNNLTANQTDFSIILDWNASVDVNSIWHYEIERSDSEIGVYEKYGTSTNFLTTTFTDMNPLNGMNYYRVKFIGSYSRESDYAYVSCNYILYNDDGDKPTLLAPSRVYATIIGTGIKVTWDKVSNASDYKIYRSNNENGDYENLIGRVGDVDNWTDYNPQNGNNCYKVKAFNLYESNFSDASCGFFP